MGWLRRHPELVILAAFAVVVVVGVVRYQTRAASSSDTAGDVPTSSAPAAAQSVSMGPSPAASVVVSDNPAFDLTGSGDACRMHYFQDGQGRTVTLFYLTRDGELITHVSGPPGIGRHDEQFTRGVNRIVYDFPLSQAIDMGAVLYLPDGSSQSCTISAGADTP
jgi:hypothetical protein